MWHAKCELPPEGYITVDLGGNYEQVFVVRTPMNTYLHCEPGVDFRWADVKRWAELPPDAVETSGCEIIYKLH